MMNHLKILTMIGIITALCSNFAWAGSVDIVDIVEVDEGRNAVVTVTLCDGETIGDPQTVSDDDMFYILLSAKENINVDCKPIEEKILVPVPPCNEYSKIVALLHIATSIKDEIKIDWSIDSYDDGLDVDIEGCCWEKRAICEEDLAVCIQECNSETSCESTCKELFTCEKDYDMCVMVDEPEITVECHPETLNLKSNGNYITCYLMSSVEDGIYDIDEDTLYLHYLLDSFPAVFSEIEDDHLMVKFSRPLLQESIQDQNTETEYPAMIDLIVSGEQNDLDYFEATDSMRVIKPGNEKSTIKTKTKTKAKKEKK